MARRECARQMAIPSRRSAARPPGDPSRGRTAAHTRADTARRSTPSTTPRNVAFGACVQSIEAGPVSTPTQETMRDSLSRRDAIKLGLGAGAFFSVTGRSAFALPMPWGTGASLPLIERAIPSTGEKVPVVGMGTARNYEHPTAEQLPVLRDVLKTFPELGGKVLDTAPSYGDAEIVVGNALAELGNRDKYFLATKVSVPRSGGDRTAVETQMNAS